MPKKNPSTRWFFNDWHNDKGLQLCSLAARGLWIEMLTICAAAGGYLLVNDKAPSIIALARYVGATPSQTRRLLAELEEHEVFSRDAMGRIFCRRMVRENENGADREHDPNQAEIFDPEDPPTRDPSRLASRLSLSPPTPPPQGGLDKIMGGKKKPPRRTASNLNGVTEHRPAFAPLRDSVEIAKEMGLPK